MKHSQARLHLDPAADVRHSLRMSSEPPTKPDAPAVADTDPAPAPAFDPIVPKCRLVTYVQGGTSTWENDKEVARKEQDAERRRDEQDQAFKQASKPIDGGGAKMFSHNFCGSSDPQVVLSYTFRDGGGVQILSELVTDEITGKRILTVVCPECVRRGLPSGQAQMCIREDNRAWHIDTRTLGQPASCEDMDFHSGRTVRRVYVSAGIIKDSETFNCPCGCGSRYRIHDNMLRRE